ncbi:MAG: N-acetylmuramoyl-L-alanine amidase [Fimbriimonadaceae bacterium]
MKRWIACLAPWMVLASAASAAKLEPVSVQLTYNTPSSSDAFRVGDQCYITPKLAKQWDWNLSIRGDEMQVATEGRLFRVPTLREEGQYLLSLTEAARYLGAIGEWDGNTYRVLGRIRNVELNEKGLQVDSTIKVKPRFFRLSSPDRYIIDFLGGRMDVPDDIKLPAWWRVGQYDPNTARIVLEHPAAIAIPSGKADQTRQFILALPQIARTAPDQIKEPITPAPDLSKKVIDPSFTLDLPEVANDYNAGTLITVKANKNLDQAPGIQYINPTTLQVKLPKAAYRDMVSRNMGDSRWINSFSTSSDGESAILTLQTKRALAFSASTSGNTIRIRLYVPSSSGTLNGKVIVVDPGHGGKDSGASSNGVTEKNLTLTIGQALGEALSKAGASVIMTRDSDIYPSLTARAQIANDSKAAVFVSVHINSINKDNSRSGGITFFHMQDPEDRLLAECIQSEIGKVSYIPDLGTWSDRRIYQSGFSVLRNSTVPSVLIEMGFINHKNDRAQMTQKDFADRVAKAIVRGIQIFLGEQ